MDIILTNDEEQQADSFLENHPWLQIKSDSLEEEIRFSLDEIRIA